MTSHMQVRLQFAMILVSVILTGSASVFTRGIELGEWPGLINDNLYAVSLINLEQANTNKRITFRTSKSGFAKLKFKY